MSHVATVYTMEALPGGHPVSHVSLLRPLPAGTKLYLGEGIELDPHIDGVQASPDVDPESLLQAEDDKRQEFQDRVLRLLTELEEEGILTEGQCSEVWGGDRLDWRMASRPMPPAFGQEP